MKLLVFKQKNCTPCKMAEQFYKGQLGVEPDETHFVASGNEESDNLAMKYMVMQSPTFVLVDDEGNEIEKVRGVGQGKIKAIFEKRGLI